MKYYANLQSFKLIGVEDDNFLEEVTYSSFEELMEQLLQSRTSTELYVYDLKYHWLHLSKYALSNGYENIGAKDSMTGRANVFSVLTSFREDAILDFRIKKNTRGMLRMYEAKTLLGSAEVEDIMDCFGEDADNSIALAIASLRSEGHTSNTISGNAFNDLINKDFNGNRRNYDATFPVLNQENDEFTRLAYFGGFSYLNPNAAGVEFAEDGCTYDVNSMFPAIMEQKYLPYGAPVSFVGKYEEDRKYPLYIQQVKVEFLTLKEGGIPCIMNSDDRKPLDCVENVILEQTLTLTNYDLELFLANYDFMDIEYIGGLKFKQSKNQFKNFIKYWKDMKIKAEKGSFQRLLAKLMLNSLYGKFGSKVYRQKCEIRIYNGFVKKFPVQDFSEGAKYYVPLSCFISSLGRYQLVKAIEANKDAFIYADTDSIHLLGTEAKGIEVDDSKFGAWKLEKVWSSAKFLAKKKYAEVDKETGVLDIKCAGLPREIIEELTMEDFELGASLDFERLIMDEEGNERYIEQTFTIGEDILKYYI